MDILYFLQVGFSHILQPLLHLKHNFGSYFLISVFNDFFLGGGGQNQAEIEIEKCG